MLWKKEKFAPSRKRTTTSRFSPDIIPTEGRNNSASTETRYRLDNSRIESRQVRDFRLPCRPALGSAQGTGPLLGVKRPWRGVDHPSPSSAEVKRVELYLYSTSAPAWPVLQ